jgi:hypothetical protein
LRRQVISQAGLIVLRQRREQVAKAAKARGQVRIVLIQNVVDKVAHHFPVVFLGNHVQEEWQVVGRLRSGGVVACLGIKNSLLKASLICTARCA